MGLFVIRVSFFHKHEFPGVVHTSSGVILIGGRYMRELPPLKDKKTEYLHINKPEQGFSMDYHIIFGFNLNDVFEYISTTDTWRALSITNNVEFSPRFGINLKKN